jgi:activator of 2-hydroxyglutaryl-CoA dehydratase
VDITETLKNQATEIAEEGHAGWGNTMLNAALEIDRLRNELSVAEKQLDQIRMDGDR